MDSFLLCLRVECLEQFALLQFVQSTACMSLGDPAGFRPERHVHRGPPGRGLLSAVLVLQKLNPERRPLQLYVKSDVLETATQNY